MQYISRSIMNRYYLCMVVICWMCTGCFQHSEECFLKRSEITQELKNIEQLIQEYSPYIEMHSDRVYTSLDMLQTEIQHVDRISKQEFSLSVNKVLAELGDRHYRVGLDNDCVTNERYYLPFTVAPLEGEKVVALKKNASTYQYFIEGYPWLQKISGTAIDQYIAGYNYRDKYAPTYSRHLQGVRKLDKFYKIKSQYQAGDTIGITLSSMDFKKDTTLVVQLSDSHSEWLDVADAKGIVIEDIASRATLFRNYDNKVAYIKLPRMYGVAKYPAFFDWLGTKMQEIKDSHALIIDIRNNQGGNRELITYFANYLIPPQTHWVANLAKYKGRLTDDVQKGFAARFLYPYKYYTSAAKTAIDDFRSRFVPAMSLDDDVFTADHYMVLEGQTSQDSYYYAKPVYILINEKTFSAASVFAAAFKGVQDVQLVGICTDGSSGMSKEYRLDLSDVEIKISHMFSFQRNGQLFDGHGTQPDIRIDSSLSQVMGEKDHQLEVLLHHINKQLEEEESNKRKKLR